MQHAKRRHERRRRWELRLGLIALLGALAVTLVLVGHAEGADLKDRYTALNHTAHERGKQGVGRNIRAMGVRYRWVSSNHRGRHWNTRPATERDYAREIRRLRVLLHPPAPRPPHLVAIAGCESGHRPDAVSSTGKYRGLFQFDYRTWASVGGSGDPAAASVDEQYRRAGMLYARAGAAPWPVCGR
jgi:hypothetical protein